MNTQEILDRNKQNVLGFGKILDRADSSLQAGTLTLVEHQEVKAALRKAVKGIIELAKMVKF